MPNGSLAIPAEHTAQANAHAFTEKTLNQANGAFVTASTLIQH